MTKLHRLLALSAVALATAFGVPADAAERAAEGAAAKSLRAFPALTRIYRFTGLTTTSRTAHTGVQVSAHCTNWHASNTLVVRFVFRDFNGTIVAQGNFNLTPFRTFTVSTASTLLFFDDATLVPTALNQGSLEILATGPQVHCSAQLTDAGSANASGVVTLAATRNNQESGAQE